MHNPIKIKIEKLGKKRRYAEAEFESNTIFIDHRVKGRKFLEMLIHEGTHLLQPYLDEEAVTKYASELTRLIWDANFKQIDNDASEPLQDELIKQDDPV